MIDPAMKEERLKALKDALEPVANEMAEKMVGELEVKGPLLQPKEVYLRQKKEEILDKFDKEMRRFEEGIFMASELLKERLQQLPLAEKQTIEKEMDGGFSFISGWLEQIKEGKAEMPKPDQTLQSLLHFSDKTLLWIYDVGYTYFQKAEYDKAGSIFQLLTLLNHLVSDYWVAYGLTLRRQGRGEQALYALGMASLTNPDNPISHYNCAELYLEMHQTDQAFQELQALETLAKAKNLIDLQPSIEDLRNRIRFAKAS